MTESSDRTIVEVFLSIIFATAVMSSSLLALTATALAANTSASADDRSPSSIEATAFTLSDPQPNSSVTINDDVQKSVRSGTSMAPLVAYDPTYGLVLGGAYFYGSTAEAPYRYGLIMFGTTQGNFGADFRIKKWFGDRWFYSMHAAGNNLYAPYYGEGNRTLVEDRVDIATRLLKAAPVLGYRLSNTLSLALGSELSFREATDNTDPDASVIGRDFTPAMTAALEWDERDDECDPHSGRYSTLLLRYGPSNLSTREDAQSFGQIELDFRKYFPVFEHSVFATELIGGATVGDPGYQYRYSLGSDRLMRGFATQRYRGEQFYAAQVEWRQELGRWISIVGFADMGDIADRSFNEFGPPKFTYGPGIRIGLPPDRIAKLRLDYGKTTNGESAFYLNFNEAF